MTKEEILKKIMDKEWEWVCKMYWEESVTVPTAMMLEFRVQAMIEVFSELLATKKE